ncbi:MAG: cell division protein FtsA [Bacteroidia bacterium]|nr:cell division protein FtsA [Bacteroidia bacterium]MDW8016056.1 cell division protein FtsA [Bacteroidia bacterium]
MNEKPMKDIYSVIDIGTQQVRVLIGQPDGGNRVSVLGVGLAPAEGIDENGVANIERLVYAIQRALHTASQQSGIILRKVWVVVNHIHMRGEETQAIITFPHPEHEIGLADLERLRRQAVQRPSPAEMELIHVIPQSYDLDHRRGIRDPLGMTGIRLEGHFYLVYAPQTHLTMLRRCFQRLQLEIEGFIARPVAAAEVFLSREHKGSGAALLYLGTHSTGIVLYSGGILRRLAILPLGGYHVTADIREMLRYILLPQAEELKIQQGVAFASRVSENEILRLRLSTHTEPIEVSRHTLARVIQARLEETMVFVAREIEQAGLLGKLYGGIHLAGGGALMPEIETLVEYVLGERAYRVQVGHVLGRGVVSTVDTPRMAGALATLYLVPILREFMPPLTSPSAKENPSAKTKAPFLNKVRSFLESSLKLPQDLID